MLGSAAGPFTRDFIAEHGGKVRKYKRQDLLFSQGDPAHELFYILSGKVLVNITSEDGRQALIAILGPDQFFGECCLSSRQLRNSTVEAATECEVAVFQTNDVVNSLSVVPNFAKRFAAFLMVRNDQLNASLADQIFLSSEKRLARLLLKLAQSGDESASDFLGVPINQEMIAKMVGTTRSRISSFMNKFRKLGYIEYNGVLKVHQTLNSILSD